MEEIKKGKILEITVNELVEKYDWLLTESSVQSIKKYGKMQTKTKKSVIKALEENFESVEYIAGKKNQKAKFILTNYNCNTEVYNPYKNNGGQPLDWTNEINCIQELINQEVARNQDELCKGFTISRILALMLGFGSDSEFDKAKKKDILENAIKESSILSMLGNKDDYYGLKETVNNLIRNQRHIYVAMIEKEIKKTNHIISYLDSNGEEIDVERYEEYMIFKNKLSSKIQVENNKEKELKNEYFKAYMRTKVFKVKTIIEIEREVDNAVQEKFGFKYAYRLFTIFDEIQVGGEGDIDKVRENYFNRIMKNANSSQSKYKQTEEIKYFEKPFYRLVHVGLYVEVMESFFSKLVNFESKTESNTVDVLDNSVAEDDDEALQEHLDGLEQYVAEQRLEQEDYFYNQDDYVDVDRILYEMENPLSDEECEERYNQMVNDIC